MPSIPTLEDQGGIENSWADLKQSGEVKDLCGVQVLFIVLSASGGVCPVPWPPYPGHAWPRSAPPASSGHPNTRWR